MGDNFESLMTIEEARVVVRSANPKKSDLRKAEIVLSLANWYGDRAIAREMRKARFLEKLI